MEPVSGCKLRFFVSKVQVFHQRPRRWRWLGPLWLAVVTQLTLIWWSFGLIKSRGRFNFLMGGWRKMETRIHKIVDIYSCLWGFFHIGCNSDCFSGFYESGEDEYQDLCSEYRDIWNPSKCFLLIGVDGSEICKDHDSRWLSQRQSNSQQRGHIRGHIVQNLVRGDESFELNRDDALQLIGAFEPPWSWVDPLHIIFK